MNSVWRLVQRVVTLVTPPVGSPSPLRLMPRKKLVCALPPPRRPRGARGVPADSQLLEILRRLALTHQQAEPQLFYPLRDAARELGAPLSAISRAYEALKKEGILGTIRASRTVIEGRAAASSIHFKGFIGLPVSLSCFLTLQDYRNFYFALRRESHRRGFVSNLLFFSDDPKGREELSDLIKEFGVQIVIWLLPRLSAEHAILTLKDHGVRFVGIGDGGVSARFCKYEIRRDKALAGVLRKWRIAGHVTHLIILRAKPGWAADDEILAHGIERAGLSYEYRDVDPDVDPEIVLRVGTVPHQGAILQSNLASLFSFRAPEAFGHLLRGFRVLLPDGAPTVPCGAVPDGRIDLLTVDWPVVAKRMVYDLTTKRAFDESASVVFEASARFGVSLRESCADL